MADTSSVETARSKHIREKLFQWDDKLNAKAVLTDVQKDSVIDVTSQSNIRRLPIELPLDDFPTILSNGKDCSSNSSEQINTAQEFFNWYAEAESLMEKEGDDHQIEFVENLKNYVSQCDKVIEETEQCLEFLTVLKTDYIRVATKTNALHEACENLLEEQTQCVNAAECINSRLSYFSELDRISSKINAPTFSINSESFLPILVRIDECIEYLSQHPQYKESSTYLMKFHMCLARALSLVKAHVFSALQTATQLVIQMNNNQEKTGEDAFILLYGKFRTYAPKVKVHIEKVEQRLDKSSEYGALLADCHQFYFQQRLILLSSSVSSAINELAAKHAKDHCSFIRSGCAFMVHVCEDEHNLFAQFFTLPASSLDEMLENLCMNLYDAFRPLLIHIVHLETLSELCSILKVEMLEEHVQPNNMQALAAFQKVCSQMLQDVQERLVYRTHIFINREILNYNPASGDLAYPEKLDMMKSIAEKIKLENTSRSSSVESSFSRQNSESSVASLASQEVAKICEEVSSNRNTSFSYESSTNMPLSPADLHGMWYPTVRRSLLCLSKLYRCVDRSTFQGLSQDILSFCVQSLVKAGDSIKTKKSELDGLLFLTKHLLILREQIIPFHIDSAIKETSLDFSKIKQAARDLLKSRSKLFSLNSTNAVLQFLLEGTPAVLEKYVDCRQEVDDELKKSCEEFIKHVTHSFVGNLNEFLSKASVILNKLSSMPNEISLRVQPFASPENLRDVVTLTYKNLKQKKPAVSKSMSLYLANEDTEYILFKPIKSNVLQSFHNLHQLLHDHYTEEDRQIIAAPTIEQINVLLASSVQNI